MINIDTKIQQTAQRKLTGSVKNVRTTTPGKSIRVPMFKEPLFRNKSVKTVINPNTVTGTSTPKNQFPTFPQVTLNTIQGQGRSHRTQQLLRLVMDRDKTTA